MKKIAIGAIIALISPASYPTSANQLVVANPTSLHWHPASSLKGAEVAVLSGNPDKKEAFIARVKLPAGFLVPLHRHEINEYDTVISGALYLGIGNHIDRAKTQRIPAGSFVMIPAKMPHYAMTKEETVLQVNGMGPWGMVYRKDPIN